MALPALDFRTPEERQRDYEKWVTEHYLEDGKVYTFEINRTWYSGWSPNRIDSWGVYIRQCFCPWMSVAYHSFNFRTAVPFAGSVAKARAEKWGREYLNRGGPPEGFFDPPPPDPNAVLFRSDK